MSALTYPSGKVLSVTYGADGEVDSLTFDGQVLLENAQWTVGGAIAGWSWGLPGLPVGKSTVAITHDGNGLPNGYQDADTRQIVRDDDRRVTAIDDLLDVGKSQVFTWEAAGRLSAADIGAWSDPMGYAWNANSNLTAKVDAGANNGLAWTMVRTATAWPGQPWSPVAWRVRPRRFTTTRPATWPETAWAIASDLTP